MNEFIPGAYYRRNPFVAHQQHKKWWDDQCLTYGYDERTLFKATGRRNLERPGRKGSFTPVPQNWVVASDSLPPLEDFL